MEGFEGGGEGLADHEALGEFVGEEVVALVGEEGAELFSFEGGVVVDGDAEFVLLLVVHKIIININYYNT